MSTKTPSITNQARISGTSSEAGYEVILANAQGYPASYTCPVCKRLLRDPHQAACGDRFCKACIAQLFLCAELPKCPHDDIPLFKEDFFKDAFAEREILSLLVLCSSTKDRPDCKWRGSLRNLQDHEKVCEFVKVLCPKTGCGMHVLRNKLPVHMAQDCLARSVRCEHCHEEVPLSQLQKHKETTCTKAPVGCPNNCSETRIPRHMLNEHRRTCPLEKVYCYYSTVGCSFVGARQELPEHHNHSMASHLQFSFQAFQSNQSQLTAVKNSHDQLQAKYTTLESKLDSLVTQVQALSAGGASNVVQHRSDFQCQRDERSFEVPRQSLACALPHGPTLTALEHRMTSVERTAALHDIQLAEVTLRQDLTDVKQTNGVLLWKLTEFGRRQREAVSGKAVSLYSPPFYTSPCGYKLCARLYPNGDGIGRGTHLSLFLVVMKGEYDALLPWPFSFKVSLSILDQNRLNPRNVVETFRPDPSSSSFQRPDAEMNVASGCPLFLQQGDLSGQYVKDDSLFVKITVHNAASIAPDTH